MADRRTIGYVSAYPVVVTSIDAPYGVATGGNTTGPITDSVSYTLLTFTADGTLVVTTAGLFDVLLVAGGGGGASLSGSNSIGGGGGGGGVFRTTVYLDATSYAVTVGAGGTANSQRGFPSCIAVTATLTTVGGITAAGGGTSRLDVNQNASETSGGCGAGSIQAQTNFGAGFVGQGFGGGSRQHMGTNLGSGGGGGGSAAAGSNGVSNTGGNGGAGKDVSTFIGNVATTNFKGGGGGGGGSDANGSAGSGNGAANSGGGGRGSPNNTSPTSVNDGYTGVVFVRFKI